jgi:hypothetical protein
LGHDLRHLCEGVRHTDVSVHVWPAIAALEHYFDCCQPDALILVVQELHGTLQRLWAVRACGHLQIPQHDSWPLAERLAPVSLEGGRSLRIAGLARFQGA